MGINTIMKNALRTNWAKTDDFQFTFANKHRPLNVTSSGMSVQDVLDMTVMNLQLPELGSQAESIVQAGEWRIYNAKFQPFTLSLTFRDFGSLDLRRYFSEIWMDCQRGYFDVHKSYIKVSIAGEVAFESEDCLITNVSQVDLSNENSQITEFTVQFTSPYYSAKGISKFGSDAYFKAQGGFAASLTQITSLDDAKNNLLGPLQDVVSTVGNFVSNFDN